ncbi:protein of unknown function (plasmid) [Methylocella tundrae]|uniref:Uncharacterized protein n=1 Tax=Methylocella tundrae TaxID=227605 RepID=A0A4U8Z7U4_METTU|nr:protein of unknown function [Methylocella tundrae]
MGERKAQHGILDNEILIEDATRARERDFLKPGFSVADILGVVRS